MRPQVEHAEADQVVGAAVDGGAAGVIEIIERDRQTVSPIACGRERRQSRADAH